MFVVAEGCANAKKKDETIHPEEIHFSMNSYAKVFVFSPWTTVVIEV